MNDVASPEQGQAVPPTHQPRAPLPTLESARLILRPFTAADEAAHAAIWAKPEVVRFFQPEGEQAVRHAGRNARVFGTSWSEGALRGGIVPFAVVERRSGRLVGHAGVRIHDDLKQPELTLFLDSAVWGHGYATEGASAALDHGFAAHELHAVIAVVMADNAASHRVVRRLGFEATGPHLQWNRVMTLYQLTRAQWRDAASQRTR